jgi:hypothetical protein
MDKIGKFFSIGLKLVPYIGVAINTIEAVAATIKELKGPAKKEAVLNAITKGIPIAENFLDKDVLNDPKVVEAVGDYIDAYVALQNAIAASKQVKGTGEPK